MKLILASGSPRRRERLEENGYEFSICPADIDENLQNYFQEEELSKKKKTSPETLVQFLAKEKSKQITLSFGEWVISCDTVVWQDGEILEKPKDFADAKRMLTLLSGRYHEVISGYCLRGEGQFVCGFEKTKVKFKNLSEEEIESYIKNFPPYDKAGAYGIQDGVCVEQIVGDYNNVLGFPEKIFEELKKIERSEDK